MKDTYQLNTGIDLTWAVPPDSGTIDLSGIAGTYVTNNTTAIPLGGSITTMNTGTVLNTSHNYGMFEDHYISKRELDGILDTRLKKIERRLAILDTPSKEVLDRYESLRAAYEHYCTLEALMYDEIQRTKQEK